MTQVEGAPGKWRIALNTQAIEALGQGRFALSAVATDAAGLKLDRVRLSTAEDDTCWLGVVVIDQSAPNLESAELTLAPLLRALRSWPQAPTTPSARASLTTWRAPLIRSTRSLSVSASAARHVHWRRGDP